MSRKTRRAFAKPLDASNRLQEGLTVEEYFLAAVVGGMSANPEMTALSTAKIAELAIEQVDSLFALLDGAQ